MRVLLIAATVLLPMIGLAQTGSPSGGASGGGAAPTGGSSGVVSPPSMAPNVSPTQTAPVGPSPTSPNVSPTRTAPLTSATGGQVRPDPSPTQAAPVDARVPGGGTPRGALNGRASAVGTAPGRTTPQQQTTEAEAIREREAREARLRASEERLRSLIRDICTGCDYSTLRPRTTTSVVRARG